MAICALVKWPSGTNRSCPHAVHQTGIVGGIDIREIPDLLIGHIHIAVRLLYGNCDGNGLMVLFRQGDGALIDPHRTGKAQLQNGRLCGVVLVAGPGKVTEVSEVPRLLIPSLPTRDFAPFSVKLFGELIDQTAISRTRPAGDGQSYCDALLILHGHDLGNSGFDSAAKTFPVMPRSRAKTSSQEKFV